jgi:hypothetical protein
MSVIIPPDTLLNEIQKPWVIDLSINKILDSNQIEAKAKQEPKTLYIF